MKNFLKKNQSNRDRSQAFESIKSLNDVFRAYYLNVEKLNEYFDQEYAGFVKFSTTLGNESARSLGISAASSA